LREEEFLTVIAGGFQTLEADQHLALIRHDLDDRDQFPVLEVGRLKNIFEGNLLGHYFLGFGGAFRMPAARALFSTSLTMYAADRLLLTVRGPMTAAFSALMRICMGVIKICVWCNMPRDGAVQDF
jgi:hypothetical protein